MYAEDLGVPEAITVSIPAGALAVEWEGGQTCSVEFDRLRRDCPCSQCRQLSDAGWVNVHAEPVTIRAIRPVGRYGVQILFSDGHDRGIYPWSLLTRLAQPRKA